MDELLSNGIRLSPAYASKFLSKDGLDFVRKRNGSVYLHLSPKSTRIKHCDIHPQTISISTLREASWFTRRMEKLFFFRSLACFYKSGIPITAGLRLLAGQTSSAAVRENILALLGRVCSGNTLAQAARDCKAFFSPVEIALFEAGEESGKLDKTLEYLALYEEKQQAYRNEVFSSLFYPLALLAFGVATLLFTTRIFLGSILSFVKSLGGSLPWISLFAYNVNCFFSHPFSILVFSLALFFVGKGLWKHFQKYRLQLDQFLLALPFMGELLAKVVTARLVFALQLLYEAGIPLHRALQLAGGASGNAAIQHMMEDVSAKVEQGAELGEAVAGCLKLPSLFRKMLEIGEASGRLSTLLSKTVAMLEDESRHSLRNLVVLAEPFFLLLSALVVLASVIVVFVPLIDSVVRLAQ